MSWDLFHFKVQSASERNQVIDVGGAVPAKTMIVPNNYFLDFQLIHQNIADKLRSRKAGKRLGKGLNDKVIKPHRLEDLPFFIQSIQQFDVRILLENHPRMGKKCEDRRPQIHLFGIIYETFQYFTMTYVNTVKSTYGYGRKVLFIVIGNALNRYHPVKKIKRLTFKPLNVAVMKTKLHLVFSITILMGCFYGSAQTDYWRSVSTVQNKMPAHLQRLDTKQARFFTLDQNALKSVMSSLNNRAISATVYFPNAKGELIPYNVMEASVMAPELSAKFPGIRSYKGKSLRNNKDRIRISVSQKGVQTMIVHAGTKFNTYMDRTTDPNIYVVYQKSAELGGKENFDCKTAPSTKQTASST